MGNRVESKARTFSTLGSMFISHNPDLMIHLPFVLSKKMGFSKQLMQRVHEGMMSPNGLASTLNHLERRRRNRFYELLTKFAYTVRRNHGANPSYLAPTPPTAEAYLKRNSVTSRGSLTFAWMKHTELYSSLCEMLMKQCVVKKVIRIDHSVKFCKRLKNWEGHGLRDNLVDAKMLLLLQNEIGQIVGRRLTSSENKEETMELLEEVQSQFQSDGECYLVSDNASAVRNFVGSVYGASVVVKQDPFHVIQRFSEKVKCKSLRKRVCKELSSALYDVDRELRPPAEMEANVREVLSRIPGSELGCTTVKWDGCIEHNVEQIQKGDLYVPENVYREGGGPAVRMISTSQLEGFHSALKKLLAREVRVEIGLRILDVFIVQHNIDVGARFGRNAAISNADLIAACRAATICKLYGDGQIESTTEHGFLLRLVSELPFPAPQYRSSTPRDFLFSSWKKMFQSTGIDEEALEANLTQSRQHMKTIKELLLKNATTLQSGLVASDDFMHCLRMDGDSCEGAAGFSLEEHELLRQVLREQSECARVWGDSVLVTTIMFNLVVDSNKNARLKLRRRSFRTVQAKLKLIQKEVGKPSATTSKKLFHFQPSQQEVARNPTDREKALQRDIFDVLRATNCIGQKRIAFCQVYDFASCVCNGIRSFTRTALMNRWGTMKKNTTTESYKIKLKIVRSEQLQFIEAGNEHSVVSAEKEVGTGVLNTLGERLMEGEECCSPPRSTSSHESTIHVTTQPQYELVRPTSPVKISREHMDILVEEAERYKNIRGKAAHLMQIFRQFYPGTAMTNNQLRMRIRKGERYQFNSRRSTASNDAPLSDPATTASTPPTRAAVAQAPITRKRKATSCQDCRVKHVKCGDPKENPRCLKLSQNQSNTLDKYLSTR